MHLGKLWEIVKDREPWRATVHRVTESDTTGRLNNNLVGLLLNECYVYPIPFCPSFLPLWCSNIGRTDAEAETSILWPPDA